MPLTFNDGNIPFGSILVQISGFTGDWVAEDIDFEEKSTTIIRRNEVNVPNGAVHIQDLIKGKMTLQLREVGEAIPEGQTRVTMNFRGSPKDWVITNLSQPFKQDQIHKLKMEITEILNP